jgi:uncharacterized membrane protein YoaK (UPF0700 family)
MRTDDKPRAIHYLAPIAIALFVMFGMVITGELGLKRAQSAMVYVWIILLWLGHCAALGCLGVAIARALVRAARRLLA